MPSSYLPMPWRIHPVMSVSSYPRPSAQIRVQDLSSRANVLSNERFWDADERGLTRMRPGGNRQTRERARLATTHLPMPWFVHPVRSVSSYPRSSARICVPSRPVSLRSLGSVLGVLGVLAVPARALSASIRANPRPRFLVSVSPRPSFGLLGHHGHGWPLDLLRARGRSECESILGQLGIRFPLRPHASPSSPKARLKAQIPGSRDPDPLGHCCSAAYARRPSVSTRKSLATDFLPCVLADQRAWATAKVPANSGRRRAVAGRQRIENDSGQVRRAADAQVRAVPSVYSRSLFIRGKEPYSPTNLERPRRTDRTTLARPQRTHLS